MKLKLVRDSVGGSVASLVNESANRHSGVRPSPLSTRAVEPPFAATALGYSLGYLVEATRALGSAVLVLEDGELLPLGHASAARLSPSDRRRLGHALFARRIERTGGLGCFGEPFQHTLVLPFFDEDLPLGVVCLGSDEPFADDIDFGGSVELVGLALAGEVRRSRRANDTADLVEMSRLASLGMLLVSVAHELRGPAGALALLVPDVRAALAVARPELAGTSAVFTEEAADMLGRDLARCSERILDLCEQLRGASRRDALIEATSLADIAREAIEIARLHAPAIIFTLGEIGQGFNAMVRRGEIAQIVQNLLLNAIDACRSGSGDRIDVLVATDPDGASVEVADNGTGVAPEIAEAIFRPFFTTKARGKGTGVGLYVSREIAVGHGGELTVANNAAGGATFVLRLPSAAPMARPPGIQRASTRPLALSKRRARVLFVDDDDLVLRTYRRALTHYDVTAVSSLAEAKHELALGTVDVVLADLGMPGGGGATLHAWMVETLGDEAPPLVFLTGGFTSASDQAYVERSGCTCLMKPAPIKDLAAAIDAEVADRECG